MILWYGISWYRLHVIRKNATHLQNPEIRNLYSQCLQECDLHKTICLYDTAYLKAPVSAGLFKPVIYLPGCLINHHSTAELRFMLLHELQHIKHHDALSNYLIMISRIFYWFNPVILYALTEMKHDREIACDTAVLDILQAEEHELYGHTLIKVVENTSRLSFFTGISGTMRQMKKRIKNIVSYKKERPSAFQKRKGIAAFSVILILSSAFVPLLSAYAADDTIYQWNCTSRTVNYEDYSSFFGAYNGSFVLYDQTADSWSIYNPNRAVLRVSPDSTYKIYNALMGLEENIITPDHSLINWDQTVYPFDAWNADQTLSSAMISSVNWYFQSIDQQLGKECISNYYHKLEYGNQNTTGNLSSYWLESSLKISAIEQVELLSKFHQNTFGFDQNNVDAVKNALSLSVSDEKTLYGKTGTGRVNDKDVNGWFIGYIESSGHVYYFAANISANENATGSKAAEIALAILSDLALWET